MVQTTFTIPNKWLDNIATHDKEIALWLKLKVLFKRHTIIYNYTLPKLSQLTNVSVPTIKKYLPRLIKLGWVSDRHGHLTIRKFKNVTGTRRKASAYITLSPDDTFMDTVYRVRSLPIQCDHDRQQFIIDLKTERLKGSDPKSYAKKWKKYVGEEDHCNLDKEIKTSVRRVSKQIGLSQTGTWKCMKRMDEKGIIGLTPLSAILDPLTMYTGRGQSNKGWVYWYQHRLYSSLGHKIRLH